MRGDVELSTNTITATAIRCPHCAESIEPKELKRSVRVTREDKIGYAVQYECPECALRWWWHEWKRSDAV